MLKQNVLVAVSIMLMMCSASAQAEDYKLVKKDGLISLYEKWIKAINGEQTRELKVVFYVKASPVEAVALLKNQAKALDWNPGADVFKIIPGANEQSWTTYVRYDIPWPVGDQDCCLQYTVKAGTNATEVSFQGTTHSQFPAQKGVGRIAGTRGKWIFEKNGGAAMKVTYTISANKNSKLPRFVTDPIIHDNMLESMDLFTSLLENK